MTDLLKDLNPEQRVAVETTEGAVLVLSGAGTGKTRVLTTRIAYILEQNLAAPWQILALTFTNKAANEMKARVSAILSDTFSPSDIHDLWLGTFHSICLRILRRNAAAANMQPNFLVYGEDDQKSVLKTVIVSLGLDVKDYPPADWVERIASIKDKGLQPDEDKKSGLRNQIYDAYNAELARLNAVDFADIILKVLKLFVDRPDILQKYQSQFRYVMVDEFQDTNTVQHQLLKLLSAMYGNICCVGDDDQSIYSWRGAQIQNILNFERDYPNATIIRLETNYRSGEMILCAANSLIRHNRGRLGKDLKAAPGAGAGEPVHILELDSGYSEARVISETIERGVSAGAAYGSFAVLLRAGSLSRLFEEEFASRQIPYKLVGAQKFYDRMEIKDAVAYTRLLAYPFDDLSLLRIVSKPRRGFGNVFIDRARTFAAENGINLLRALRDMPLAGKQRITADEFVKLFDFDYGGMTPDAAAGKLLEDAGYMKMWRDSKDTDAKERIANINELLTNVISKYDTLAEFLEHAALMMTDDNDAADGNNTDAVPIMTIHAAKGLEFDTVFLPAWEEGIFPNEMAVGEGALEEERRLAYVAITRARKLAVITNAISRMQYGTRQYNAPSPFIAEIDPAFCKTRENVLKQFHHTSSGYKRPKPAPRPVNNDRMVGKMVTHSEMGTGVVIEEDGSILTIAFKNKGIKKVDRGFVTSN